MKTITLVIAFWLISAFARAQSCPVPTPLDTQKVFGIWKGHYTFNGNMEQATVEIVRTGASLKAIVSLPKQSINRIEFNTRICESQEIHFKSPVGKLVFEFVGTPNDKIFSGRIVVNNLVGKVGDEIFTLRREQ